VTESKADNLQAQAALDTFDLQLSTYSSINRPSALAHVAMDLLDTQPPAAPRDELLDMSSPPENLYTTIDNRNMPEDDAAADNLLGSNNLASLSLRQVAERACKKIAIGSAVLPKPLFCFEGNLDDAQQTTRNLYKLSPQDEDQPTPRNGPARTSTLLDIDPTETLYAQVLSREFNSVVIEHHLKWAPLCISSETHPGDRKPRHVSNIPQLDDILDPPPHRPSIIERAQATDRLGRYDFYWADIMTDWAIEHDMTVKGHVLVWHVTSPKILEQMDAHQVQTHLKRHIFTTMAHFKGRIHTWDVVNEALAPDGSLVENVFYRAMGPSYIETCFRWAHEADPAAKLFYNDNKVEGVGSKADALYNLLADLVAKDVPIHGCGLQAHWNAAGTGPNLCPTPTQVASQIRRIGKLGLEVHLSELDVRVSQLDSYLRTPAQQAIYKDLVAAALSEQACTGIYLWGFTDRHTWVTHFYYDDEPLIFNEDYEAKPAYESLKEALLTLCPGQAVGGPNLTASNWGNAWRPLDTSTTTPTMLSNNAQPDWLQGSSSEEDDSIPAVLHASTSRDTTTLYHASNEDTDDDVESLLEHAEDEDNDDDDDDEIVSKLPPIS
jgi:GH35 family endo-1,4-beta-xylanase